MNHILEHIKSAHVTIVALLSSAGLSVLNIASFLQGVLPTISLLVTTVVGLIAGYYTIQLKRAQLKEYENNNKNP